MSWKDIKNFMPLLVMVILFGMAGNYLPRIGGVMDSKQEARDQAYLSKVATTTNFLGVAVLDWQIYTGERFQIRIPPEWNQVAHGIGQLVSADGRYHINYTVLDLDDYESEGGVKKLYTKGKLFEAEQAVTVYMCERTGICGEIIGSRSINLDQGSGVEYIAHYNDLDVGVLSGAISEVHYSIVQNGVLYRFWTTEIKYLDSVEEKFASLDPSPIELFRTIMESLTLL